MHQEALTYLLKKEQLILVFPKDTPSFKKLLGEIFPERVEILCPLPADELMGRVLGAWADERVVLVDLGSTLPPSIFKNFLSDMLLHNHAIPYPYGVDVHLGMHKIIILADKEIHDELREYVHVVYE